MQANHAHKIYPTVFNKGFLALPTEAVYTSRVKQAPRRRAKEIRSLDNSTIEGNSANEMHPFCFACCTCGESLVDEERYQLKLNFFFI